MILTKEKIEKINLTQMVDDYIRRDEMNKILFIVPTNRKVRHLKKLLISQLPRKSADNLKIETIGALAEKILEKAFTFNTLSEGAASVLLKQSSEKANLKYFSTYRKIPSGTLEKISSVISEYKKHGISPDKLKKEVETGDLNEKRKAEDIAEIYGIYSAKCEELQSFEIGDIYNHLNNVTSEKFIEYFSDVFPSTSLIIIDGFNEFSLPEMKIISVLADIPAAQLFLEFDYYYHNKYIFGHLDTCYSRLEEFGFRKIDDSLEGERDHFTGIIKEKLFRSSNPSSKFDYSDKISIIEAVSREHEIDTIVKEIKKILSAGKIEPNEICLGFNLNKNYSGIVRDKFRTHGIPFNLTDRLNIENSSPVAAIINLLEIVENRFYYKNLFRGITNHFVNSEKINVSNLLWTSSELKIMSGLDNWRESLKNAINFPTGNEETDSGKKKNYQKALQDINAIAELLAPFSKQNTISCFLEELEKLVTTLDLPAKLLSLGGDNVEEYIKGLTAFLKTMEEVLLLTEKDEGKDKEYGIEFYLDQIRTASKWGRFSVKEKPSYGVLITSLDEIRGLKFKYLFIAGLYDGEFPTKYNPEIFFSGSFRKREETHLCEERYRFYQALSCWTDKLYLSFPGSDSKKEFTESTFLKDFRKIFDCSSVSSDDHKNIVFTKEDLLLKYDSLTVMKDSNIDLEYDKLIKRDKAEFEFAMQYSKHRYSSDSIGKLFSGFVLPENILEIENSYLAENETKEALDKFRGKTYSISQLEKFAACPFRYFVESILKLNPIEEPVEDIEAMEFGNLIHLVFYKFFVWLREQGILLTKAEQKEYSQAQNKLFEIAESELQGMSFNQHTSFYEVEKLLGLSGNREESILSKFLEAERLSTDGFNPSFFEVTFGRNIEKNSDPLLSTSEPIEIGNVKLQGKVDRIELSEDQKYFNIVDYKSGSKNVTTNDLQSGLSMQLPVYLYAVSQILKKILGKEFLPAGMYIYSLKFQKEVFGKQQVSLTRKKNVDLYEINKELFQQLEANIAKLINSISVGEFRLSDLENRTDKVCRFCKMQSVCRVVESDQYSKN